MRLSWNTKLYGNDTVTVTTTHPTDDLAYLFKKSAEADHKRSHNYTLDDKTIAQSIAYSVTYLNDMPVLGSLAWTRPFYMGALRVATKYCVLPEYRNKNFGKGTENLFRLDILDQVIQQCKIGEEQGYDAFFISQEDNSPGGRRVKTSVNTLTKYTDYTWMCTDTPVLVAPNPPDPSCWQYVMSNKEITFDL